MADPDGDVLAIAVTGIRQDEPLGGPGNTCPDGEGVGTSTPMVRAERKGGGDGRTYHVSFIATDGRGGQCEGTVVACVPSRDRRPCVDEGPLYDSTGASCVTSCGEFCSMEYALARASCPNERLPVGLARGIGRAGRLLLRAAEANTEGKARRRVTAATRALRRARRMAEDAGREGRISIECARLLDVTIADASQRTRPLVSVR